MVITRSFQAIIQSVTMPKKLVGRPPVSKKQKTLIFRKLEPYLKAGMSLNKACLNSQIPKSTVYDLQSEDSEFAERIEVAQSYQAVLINDVINSELETIKTKQNSDQDLTSDDRKFIQWLATHSRATKHQYSSVEKQINIKGYSLQRIEQLVNQDMAQQEIINDPRCVKTIAESFYSLLEN